MRRMSLLTVLAFCLACVGCGRIYGPVEEVKAFINEKQEAILEISKKLEADPTEAGVDEARKAFEARIDRLQAKKRAIREKPRGVLKADWMQQLIQSDINDTQLFDLIQQKFLTDCSARVSYASCSAAGKKLEALKWSFKEKVKRG
jgi:hypothetical protein